MAINTSLTSLLTAVCLAASASAQTAPPATGTKPAPRAVPAQKAAAAAIGAALAQLHLLVTDVQAQKTLWTDVLGATAATIGTTEVLRLPNLIVFLEQATPTGGTKGSIVDHVAFDVPDVKTVVAKLKAAKAPIVTRAEVNTLYQVVDDVAFLPDQATSVAVFNAPDGLEIELVENKKAASPAFRHVHFAAPKVTPMKEWYMDNLGATLGNRGFGFESLDVPRLPAG
jgi:catechol 2,3-dioxygenase-like lactoylglutathione lyase family enzyme